jgi:uncharacterized protein (TIGR04255 family)
MRDKGSQERRVLRAWITTILGSLLRSMVAPWYLTHGWSLPTRVGADAHAPVGLSSHPFPPDRYGTSAVPFPDRGRVVYGQNPLEEVLCQLRFPPILKIDAGVPAGFQDRIREEYPLYREPDVGLSLPTGVPQEIVQMLRSRLTGAAITRQFLTDDEKWTVTLNREFLALSTTAYKRWEEFQNHLDGPLRALIEEFSPPFVTRIGLRYRNVIRRSRFGAADLGWQDLLAPQIACGLATPEVNTHIQQDAHQVLIRLEGIAGQVWLRHGLTKDNDDSEAVYNIDTDFFTEQKAGLKDVIPTLAELNKRARRLFRWCISDALHQRMEPETLPER